MQSTLNPTDTESANNLNYHGMGKDISEESAHPLLYSITQLLRYWLLNMAGNAAKMEKRLVPMGAVQFPGSFAPELRRDSREYVAKRNWENVVRSYFTDGWDDISIWKSAVSTLITVSYGFLIVI